MNEITLAVVRGGSARERDVSLRSGEAVVLAFRAQHRAVLDWVVDDIADLVSLIAQAPRPLMVFNMVHGRGGEDGQLQALLDVLNIPYTGSGMLASAISMDKVLTKRIWRDVGLPTAKDVVYRRSDLAQGRLFDIDYPVMVKPAREGSSIGMQKVDTAAALLPAVQQALTFDDQVLVEQWIDGTEYTVAILGDQALPVIRLKTDHAFYDYDAKYHSQQTEYLCPCGLDVEQEQQLQQLALQAFQAVDARAWGRVDVMMDRQGRAYLLEVNTVPGMTDHSLVPMAAAAAGIGFGELINRIVVLSR